VSDAAESEAAAAPRGSDSGAGGPPEALDVAVVARLGALGAAAEARLFDRGRATDPAVAEAVGSILADVRARGDAALRDLARRFDGVELRALEVPRAAWAAAAAGLPGDVRPALEQAAAAIEAFHRAQLPGPLEVEVRDGVRLGRRADALARVGVYAPGGRAAYPSSVLMGVVPARVAGVGEVVVCSPPGPDGRPPAAVLAACAIGGADRLFAVGGAGAVAALAYGTASLPRVDKVVGPGNAYVTEAKRQLTGEVAIDCPAGPSEILIVADGSADAEVIAAELVAQAEHDPDAAAVVVTTDPSQIDAVRRALARRVEASPRRDIVRAALAARGGLLVADSLDEALAFSARYAPEHLLLLTADPETLLSRVRAAGTVFVGAGSSVAFGDYLTGANHVLPTGGLARAYSGLSTLDFVRWTTYQIVSSAAAAALAGPTAALASAEGLPGHAEAALLRAGEREGGRASGIESATGSAMGSASAGGPDRASLRFRESYALLRPYDPGRLPTPVDLSDNTNLFGVLPAAAEVLSALPAPTVTRYPSVYAPELKRALARLHGVEPENVTTGCGSDDVIDSAFRAFVEPGGRVAYPDPTFGVIPMFARMNAAEPVAVPLGEAFTLEVEAVLATGAQATYLCRPNNPTGTSFDRSAVARLLAEAAGLVLVDEAYADFADDDVLDLVLGSDRGVSLRTMSKAYGLAGLRIGYAVGPAALIAEIEKSRGPYKINGAAEAAAVAVLARDMNRVQEAIASAIENRARLEAELRGRGLRTWSSAANFLLLAVPAGAGGAAGVTAALRERGVAVRAFPSLPMAGDCIRVTVGPWVMMNAFLEALDAVLAAAASRERN
jgi:histidinol dehydrogenase